MKTDSTSLLTLIGAAFGGLVLGGSEILPQLAIFFALTGCVFFIVNRPDHADRDISKAIIFALVVAGYISLCSFMESKDVSHYVNRSFSDSFGFLFSEVSRYLYLIFLLLISIPFFMTYQKEGKFCGNYSSLHIYAWDRPVLFASGVFFVGVFWTVLSLGASIFSVIGVPIFKQFFFSKYFVYVAIFAGFSLAVTMLMKQEKIIGAIRHLAETLFGLLTPVLALLSAVFILMLPLSGLEPIWQSGHAAMLIAYIQVLAIIMINAVVRDGNTVPSVVLQVGAKILALTLPLFALIGLRALQLRIFQYGLTPLRIDALVLTFIAVMYSVSYAWVVGTKWRGHWDASLRAVNVKNAIIVLAVCVFMISPLANLKFLSAWQLKRAFLDGHIPAKEFDFGQLRFNLGAYGIAALDEIRGVVLSRPDAAEIARQLKLVEGAQDYEDYRAKLNSSYAEIKDEDLPQAFDKWPPKAVLFPDFYVSMKNKRDWDVQNCLENSDKKEKRCFLIVGDYVGDKENEVILIGSEAFVNPVVFYKNTKGDWAELNLVKWVDETHVYEHGLREPLKETVFSGRMKVEPARAKVLRFGERMLLLGPVDAP